MGQCTRIFFIFTLNWYVFNIFVVKWCLTSAHIDFTPKMEHKGSRKQIGLLHKKFDGKNAPSASIQGEHAN